MLNEASLTREKTEQLAYRLWQEAGCPDGQAEQTWLQAQGMIAAEQAQRGRDLTEGSLTSMAELPQAAAPPIPAAPAPRGWRAEALRRFDAWWAYPSKPRSR